MLEFKKCGRIEEQIDLSKRNLKLIYQEVSLIEGLQKSVYSMVRSSNSIKEEMVRIFVLKSFTSLI